MKQLKQWLYGHINHKHDFTDYSEYGKTYPTCTKCGAVSFHHAPMELTPPSMAKFNYSFKAKPIEEAIYPYAGDFANTNDWWNHYIDDDGYISGFYVDGYIIGKIIESSDEHILPKFWCPIQEDTLICTVTRDDIES